MVRNDPVQQALDRLSTLRHAPESPDTVEALRQALRARSNFVVARAAKIAGELRLRALVPELTSAFARLMASPAKLDKTCAALTEIVSSLYELDYAEPEIFLTAIHHIQMEGSFGPPVDVAAKMRGIAALGILRTRHPEAMREVVDLSADTWVPARLGAVRALASNGGDAGALLLRLKILAGESEPEVLGECFTGLLSQGASALSFVAKYADSEDSSIAETAILALGSSRLPGALEVLKAKWQRTVYGPLRKIILTAISLNRTEDAADFLLSLLETEHVTTAQDVLLALVAYRSHDRIRSAAEQIVHRRANPTLSDTFRREF